MNVQEQYTILVVEDNPDGRLMLCHALRRRGYSVIEAINGKFAVVEASSHRPDLILMDLTMPEMDGITAVQRILQEPKLAATPIFAVSGFATREVKTDAISAGCKEVLEKPLDIEVLLEKIKSTLNAPPVQQAERRERVRQREVERVQTSLRVSWGITRDCPHAGTITSLSV